MLIDMFPTPALSVRFSGSAITALSACRRGVYAARKLPVISISRENILQAAQFGKPRNAGFYEFLDFAFIKGLSVLVALEMFGIVNNDHALAAAQVIVNVADAARQCFIILTALEKKDRNPYPFRMNGAVADVHVKAESRLSEHPEPVQSGIGADELIAVQNITKVRRKRIERRISNDAAHFRAEAFLLRRKKCGCSADAAAVKIDPAVRSYTPFCECKPAFKVNALSKAPGEALSAAHAVTAKMRN